MMIQKFIHSLYILLAVGSVACTPHPEQVRETTEAAPIYPDYANVTIPYNIAPMNFLVREETTALQVTIRGEKDSLVVTGSNQIRFPQSKWKQLLETEKGHTLTITLMARIAGEWLRYPSFTWQVASEPLDSYLTYRLIEPGYEVWNTIQLCERNIENFDERIIADNNLVDGSCMNCHIHGNQQGNLSLFHLRGPQGGSILNRDGKLRKLSLKNDQMISAAVYGDLHPSGRYGVFSTNIIIPAFHAQETKRLEVYDTESDLALADFDQNRMILSPLTTRKDRLETFPSFSADGKWVYYCTAPAVALPDSINQLKYSLCRISFDADKGEWGNQIDTLWNASVENGSVCFPKASPDGKFLLYSISDYGTFPIWHKETDLKLLDLQTGTIDALPRVNSDRSDTYHSWSSNSHWFVFASKRGDGQYGKPYFAYIDSEGNAHKPFVLPQQDPAHYDHTLKSYNIPDLSATSVPFNATSIRQAYQKTQAEIFK